MYNYLYTCIKDKIIRSGQFYLDLLRLASAVLLRIDFNLQKYKLNENHLDCFWNYLHWMVYDQALLEPQSCHSGHRSYHPVGTWSRCNFWDVSNQCFYAVNHLLVHLCSVQLETGMCTPWGMFFSAKNLINTSESQIIALTNLNGDEEW